MREAESTLWSMDFLVFCVFPLILSPLALAPHVLPRDSAQIEELKDSNAALSKEVQRLIAELRASKVSNRRSSHLCPKLTSC